MSELETPPRSHQNDVDDLLNGIDEADEVLVDAATILDPTSSTQITTTNIILEEGNNHTAHGEDLMINGDLLSSVIDNSSSIVPSVDQTKSKQLSSEEIQLMKRQKEEVPFLMSSFPNVKTSFGYKSNFHTACPYTARVICYCTKFFQNSKQEQRYIHNTKSILEMYCKSRPEYAKEFGFNHPNQPTLNSTIIISRDRLEGIANTYSDVIDNIASNKPQQEVIDENDALIQLIDEFPQPEETVPMIITEPTDSLPIDVPDSSESTSLIEIPTKTETESQSTTKIFSETDLSQIPKKRGRPRTRKLCKICNSFEQETKFIQCLSCNSYFHTFCYTPNLEHLEQIHKDNWLCSDCKICLKCRKGPNEGTLVFCDYCDCGYHVDKCLTDSQKPEEGKKQWFCPNCLENHSEGIEDFKNNITSTKTESSSKTSPSEEKKTKTPKKKKKKK